MRAATKAGRRRSARPQFGVCVRHRGDAEAKVIVALLSPWRYCYHQQYLHKVPNGYCSDHGTGVSCPVGVA
jgi:peptide-methionine (S)-S-oxide reductase